MKEIKVLYLVPPHHAPGRVAAYTFLEEEIYALADSGVRIYLVSPVAQPDQTIQGAHIRTLPPGNSALERRRTLAFLAKKINLIPPHNLSSLRACYHAARVERFASDIIKRENINVIHSHFGWPSGFGGLFARAATAQPLVASFRGNDLLLDRSINYGARLYSFYDQAVRRLLRSADMTLYYSEFMRCTALSHGARVETTRVIKKGVDLEHFRVADDKAKLRANLGLQGRPIILTVAGLIPRKGIDFILEGLAQLKSSFDFSFVVCGEGPERSKLEQLSVRLGLAERTRFVGKVERSLMPQFFSACDVFVLASLVEAAGNVVLEAMASGCAVVCTNSGGPPEYVADKKSGFVVPVADARALAEKIGLLLGDSELREVMGKRARDHAAQQYPYSRMIEDVRQIYLDSISLQKERHGQIASLSFG
ncbi:MAG: glycosyltransferase family 4 protein [Pyrinomonadaceae bacterium]